MDQLLEKLERLLSEAEPERVSVEVGRDWKGRDTVRLVFDGQYIGVLVFDKCVKARGEKWAKVFMVMVASAYKGQGYGLELYRQALKHLPSDVAGITSSRNNRMNNVEVPKIYRRLGAEQIGSQFFLRRPS